MLTMKSLTTVFTGLLVASSLDAAPLKIQTGSVTFLATGKPGFLKINGSGAEAHGTLDKDAKNLTGEIAVTMDKFVTGIDLRDEHMKEKYFEVKKFPEAILSIKHFELDSKGLAKDAPFTGQLKFHGVEKDVSGTASLSLDGAKNLIEATFPIVLSDYKIDIPSYAGIKVADTVVVDAKIQAEEAK